MACVITCVVYYEIMKFRFQDMQMENSNPYLATVGWDMRMQLRRGAAAKQLLAVSTPGSIDLSGRAWFCHSKVVDQPTPKSAKKKICTLW